MIVYVFLALVILDGKPQLKGGVHETRESCEAQRTALLAKAVTTRTTRCQAMILTEEDLKR